MSLPTYSTGTASVGAGGTVVTGAGVIWSGINVKQGDWFVIAGFPAMLITEVTDATHLKIPPWPAAAQAGVAYTIYQNYVGRVVGVAAAEDVGDMLERLRDQAPIYNVPTGETEPDESYGSDGQWAYQISTGTWWLKSGGAWVETDPPLSSGGATVSDTAPASPDPGDLWFEGDTDTLWVWDGTTWMPAGGGLPSGTLPLMNGVAAAGVATAYSRGDHVHPVDTSRAAASSVPVPASALPLMDATPGVIGASTLYARQDHVHPTDTSRAPIASPTFTGNPLAPTPATTDSDTSIATTAFVQAVVGGAIIQPSGRLSYSASSALTIGDFIGATAATLWYVDTGGGSVPIWDGTAWQRRMFTGALSIALDANAGHFAYHPANNSFDVYAYWDSALGQVRLGITNTASNDFSQRSTLITDLVQKNGIWVNTLNGYLRINNTGNVAGVDYIQPGVNCSTYLGSISTVAAGQGEDSQTKRLIFNAYNPKNRVAIKKFTGTAYAYASTAYRQANADATMQVEMVTALFSIQVNAQVRHFASSSVAPQTFNVGINIDSTLIGPTEALGGAGRTNDTGGLYGTWMTYTGYPGIGRKAYKWMESGNTNITFATNSDSTKNGLEVRADI